MAFPRELRQAIPNLHTGRALELDSINGQSCNTLLFGPLVRLKLLVKETGKLSGEFVVRGDFLASHDLEDLIFVIDGCSTIVEENNRLAGSAQVHRRPPWLPAATIESVSFPLISENNLKTIVTI